MRLIKAIMQCIVIFKYRSCILASPPVPNVERNEATLNQTNTIQQEPHDGQPAAYLGQRTGKVIRSIHSELQVVETQTGTRNRNRDSELSTKQLVAEGLHISRPLVHLFSMVLFQESSWKPWLVSLAMDVIRYGIYLFIYLFIYLW
ncbi:PREDICTED: peroxisomal membrane protein PEX16-like isoform X2 [Amphimedon queenslandica]|uniref:Peroxisomal membrane protein PEX16 n=1 Tax=Amphimedon queenslandica TaxID=400682 RepID=A0AAN0JIA9_AMPQE|nr:PREDICTED: peroxisomal membrane protein PEX16-like isoform X2 [Amphimedon queenslandica]|eukprot:XP_019856709.1 PREDICTED: peroxisomal membrane protein PEX16-like isoform X2 [Amphimedon queenslandica]